MKRLLQTIVGLFIATSPLSAQVFKGGIVYIDETAPQCPARLLTRPATNEFEIRPVAGQICLQPNPQIQHTFALGALPPGQIRVSKYSQLNPNFPSVVLFDVPATGPDDKLVTGSAINSEGRASFHINGYSNVRYVVQKSTDLETWTDVQTLIGEGDFIAGESFSSTIFYRVLIRQPNGDPLP